MGGVRPAGEARVVVGWWCILPGNTEPDMPEDVALVLKVRISLSLSPISKTLPLAFDAIDSEKKNLLNRLARSSQLTWTRLETSTFLTQLRWFHTGSDDEPHLPMRAIQ